MRTWTETRREGTDCGPVDWTAPDTLTDVEKAHAMDGGITVDVLREMEAHPERFQVTTDGGWPRVGWGHAIAVRMYDGWPYWRPRAAILKSSWMGSERQCSKTRTGASARRHSNACGASTTTGLPVRRSLTGSVLGATGLCVRCGGHREGEMVTVLP